MCPPSLHRKTRKDIILHKITLIDISSTCSMMILLILKANKSNWETFYEPHNSHNCKTPTGSSSSNAQICKSSDQIGIYPIQRCISLKHFQSSEFIMHHNSQTLYYITYALSYIDISYSHFPFHFG